MKKILPFLIPILLLFVIRGLFVSVQTLMKNTQEVRLLKEQLASHERENKYLTQKINLVKSPEFVENEARSKLGLVKANEEIVIAPLPPQKMKKVEPEEKDNWEKWVNLFL